MDHLQENSKTGLDEAGLGLGSGVQATNKDVLNPPEIQGSRESRAADSPQDDNWVPLTKKSHQTARAPSGRTDPANRSNTIGGKIVSGQN